MGITIRKHRRNLSYEDATTLDELWVISKQYDRSFYREWKDHWGERGYDEYIVVTEGRLPYCESPEEYVCRMETRKEILSVLALCTKKQRERFLLHALYDLSYEEVGKICGCSKSSVQVSIEAVRKIFKSFGNRLIR
ncbi:sigma factor-like helix-turn-helix DNA-binding protein [Oscillospiraceae bacterium 44-5]